MTATIACALAIGLDPVLLARIQDRYPMPMGFVDPRSFSMPLVQADPSRYGMPYLMQSAVPDLRAARPSIEARLRGLESRIRRQFESLEEKRTRKPVAIRIRTAVPSYRK
jgi:hypothetical protein